MGTTSNSSKEAQSPTKSYPASRSRNSSMTIQTTVADGLALAQDLSRYAILSHTWIRRHPRGRRLRPVGPRASTPPTRRGTRRSPTSARSPRASTGLAFGWMGHGVHQQGQQQRARRVDPLDVPLVQPRSCLHHVPVANAEYRADARGFVVHPWMDTAGATRPSKHTVLQ